VLVEVGLRDGKRFTESGLHALAEPGFEAEAEEQIGEHRDDDRRGDRDQAEKRHEPHVQTRAGEPLPPRCPDGDEPSCDDPRPASTSRRTRLVMSSSNMPLARGPTGGAPVSRA